MAKILNTTLFLFFITFFLTTGCATPEIIRNSKGDGIRIKLETDKETFYGNIPKIARRLEFKVEEKSFEKGFITLRKGVSAVSWGELLAIFFEEISYYEIDVEIVSKRVLITNFTAKNWEPVFVDLLLKMYNKKVYALKMNCEKDVYTSCRKLGTLYLQGDGVYKNIDKALDLMEEACDGKDFKACFYLGSIYYKGDSLPADYDKSMKYFKVACKGGMHRACKAYKILYDKK